MSQATALVGTHVRDILRNHFGFRHFRKGQDEAVRSAIEGRDTIVVMPTGSGKSLCFQLPALALPGMTVVVSPLIALMKDQADALRSRGVGVAAINSTLSAAELREAEEAIRGGEMEFVYTTPERLADPEFRALLKTQTIDLLVVDEAHCLSQWGHDFRPEYLAVGNHAADLGRPPVLAFTATATDDVVDDIRRQLRMVDPEVVHTGFYRDNIDIEAHRVEDEADRRSRLVATLKEIEGTGIVYAATVKAVGELVEFLGGQGIEVAGYHGRMKASERHANQDRFMGGEIKAMVATNAFGLGIDKPDIRFVVHYNLPGTVEAYYQEIGRAGRDGNRSRAILLYDPADAKLQKFFQGGRYPSGEDLVNAHHALKRLADRPEPPKFADVAAISPLGKARLKVVLALLAGRGIVEETAAGGIRLIQPDLSPSELERAAGDYRERDERDKLKQKRMSEFAETNRCRWAALLDYFDSHELEAGECGHCDNCRELSR